MRVRTALALAALAAACSACGASAGLHIEDGGHTVRLHRVTSPAPPSPPTVRAHPTHGIELGGPAVLAYASGTLWCAVQPGPGLLGSLIMVDTTTGRRAGQPLPLPPVDQPYLLAVGADGVWLASGARLWRIDPTGGDIAFSGRLPGPATTLTDAAGSIWATVVVGSNGRVVRISPATGSVVAQAPAGPAPSALTVANGLAWVTDSVDQSIGRYAVTKAGLRQTGTIPLPRSTVRAPTQITVFGGFVWAYERGRVTRIDPASNAVVGTTKVTAASGGTIAAGSGGIWVITRTRAHRGAVRLLDAASGLAIGRRIAVGADPTAIVTDGRGAWVFDAATTRLVRVYPG